MEITRRDLAALSVVAVSPPVMAAPPTVKLPGLEWLFTMKATLAPPLEQGTIDGVRKRFIAITGGTVSGPKVSGVVLPGGGDWQVIHADGLTELDARYSLKTDDGVVIGVHNVGIRVATPEIIKRLANGEDVDSSLYYFRTAPRFDVAAGQYDWLRRRIFVARGIRKPDHVLVEFFGVG